MPKQNEISRKRLDLKDNPEIISPPIVDSPLYACATAVTVLDFVPHAELELEIAVSTLPRQQAKFPDPSGYTFRGLSPLTRGQGVRARQYVNGVPSGWSPPVTVRSHLDDYPAGPPRPEINPAPVYECGSRTGVSNLLIGCNVWINVDGNEVGRVNGAEKHQGVNVNPDYGRNQHVRAYAELCQDETPPSEQYITQPPPKPLPKPDIDDTYENGEQIKIKNLVNGARFTIQRGGSTIGPYRTWGYAHLVSLNPPFSAGESISVTQRMCPSDLESDPGKTTVKSCSDLPAPVVDPVQVGDKQIRLSEYVVGARIKVFANTTKIGDGGGAVIQLTRSVQGGETLYVYQVLGKCVGQTARIVKPQCVSPPVSYNPASRNLFPVGYMDYAKGDFKGSVYYPAEDDGNKRPFNKRVAELGRVPIIFMAHGNHATRYDPNDRKNEGSPNCGSVPLNWPEIPNHKGYEYFQRQLAQMGIIAVSVDCNETNGCTSNSISNIERRAELIMGSIKYFQSLDQGNDQIFGQRIDFTRAGLMGHSRGGEAVIVSGNQASAKLNVGIKAVISIAPVNHDRFVPKDYAFMTILPASDGDVSDNGGARFYDQTAPSPFKSQLYIDYANHNYFNRQWVNDEDSRPPGDILARGEQERILSAYGCAFFRHFLLEHNTTDFLTYRTLPPGIDTSNIHLSFEWEKQVTVDDHEQSNGIGKNSLNQSTSQSGGLTADEYDLWQGAPNHYVPNTFYGKTVGMVVECKEQGGIFRSQLDKAYNLSGSEFEIWIRAAEVSSGGSNPAGATGFELGLEDAGNNHVWVDSDNVGGLPRPFDKAPDRTKTMLTTLRFPIHCFKPEKEGGEFESKAVRAILIRWNRKEQRLIAFDVLQIVSE